MGRIAIPTGQAYTPPLICQAKKGCIEARASQLFVHNIINYVTNALQMIEWALSCKQFLETDLCGYWKSGRTAYQCCHSKGPDVPCGGYRELVPFKVFRGQPIQSTLQIPFDDQAKR